MDKRNPNDSSRPDRKIIERNRRNQMKVLYSKLNSLLPYHHEHGNSRESTSLPDQLHEAASYIKKLQTKLERMKEKRDGLIMGVEGWSNTTNKSSTSAPKSTQIRIHEMGSSLVIWLITDSASRVSFNEIVRVLHEEGAEIVSAGYSVVDDTVFHTINLTVGHESAPYCGAARIAERLNRFVNDADA